MVSIASVDRLEPFIEQPFYISVGGEVCIRWIINKVDQKNPHKNIHVTTLFTNNELYFCYLKKVLESLFKIQQIKKSTSFFRILFVELFFHS